jgi:tetratricopeptide (TPR) repeat protein
MAGSSHTSRPVDLDEQRAAFIHQEILKLIVLIAVAVVAFFVTRAIAANNHAETLRDAAEWYARGRRALADHDAAAAVDAFRQSTVLKRGDREYTLALAQALVSTNQVESARLALIALRDSAPEDAEINLELARLDARRQDVTSAVRYYRNALYAPWSADQADARRQIRLELIRFLLAHGQSSRAESELLALVGDLPDDAPAHLDVGKLFTSVGDHRRALDQFQAALRLTPRDETALAEAGLAAFAGGDYQLAERYLRSVPDQTGDVAETRAVVELVLSKDPLAVRIGSSARRSRLSDAIAHTRQRLTMCADSQRAESPKLEGLLDDFERFSNELGRTALLDNDTIESGLELVDRGERAATIACPPPDAVDRALMLIAVRHGMGAP